MLITLPVQAHEINDSQHAHAIVIPSAIEKNMVQVTKDENYRYIKSNGIPNHVTGAFPNRGNPNSISAQNHSYRVPLKPQKNDNIRSHSGIVGVALNGIPFEPGTAECYGKERGSSPISECEWREEAIVNGKGRLGLDQNNAHVQPTGSYHYHGVPHGLLEILDKQDLVYVGFAADGFPLVVSRSDQYKPSYRLKSGERPDGPQGTYTGKYTADFEYVAGLGDLDQCNGIEMSEVYVYFVTETFPYAPRCLRGTADSSFHRKKRHGSENMRGSHRRPPPHLR